MRQRKKQNRPRQRPQSEASVRSESAEEDSPGTTHVKHSPQNRCYYWLSQPIHLALVCAVASLCLYLNTHENHWAFDDTVAVVLNRDCGGETPLSNLFRNDFWGRPLVGPTSHKSFRPLTVLTFRMNNWLHGMEPRGFHQTNNALNAIAVILAVCTIDAVRVHHVPGGRQNSSDFVFLIVSALLFAFHPIHTEAVANIVGRAEILAAILAFSAFCCHRRCVYTIPGNQQGPVGGTKSRSSYGATAYFCATLVLAFTSALAKETGITILAVCGSTEIALFWLPATKRHSERTKQLPSSVVRFVLLALTGAAYLAMRGVINGERTVVRKFLFHDNPLLYASSRKAYILTALFIQAFYWWRLIYPLTLLCDYGFNVIPLVEDLGDVRNCLTLCWAMGFLCLVWKGLNNSREKGDARLLVALAWIVAPLLPASHIIPVGTVLAERLLYVPSLGYSMVIGLAAEHLVSWGEGNPDVPSGKKKSTRGKKKSMFQRLVTSSMALLFGIILIIFAFRIVRRNPDWYDNRSLWLADYTSHPQNVKIANNRARDVVADGDLGGIWKVSNKLYNVQKSHLVKFGEKSLVLYLENLVRLAKATTLSDAGERDFNKAYSLLDEALEIVEARKEPEKGDEEVYRVRGYLLSQQNQFEDAKSWFSKAVEVSSVVDPASPTAQCNMGEVLASTGSWRESVGYMEECVRLREALGAKETADSQYMDYLENLGKAYYVTKQYDKAEEIFLRTTKVREDPTITNLLNNIVAKRRQGQGNTSNS